MMIRIGLALASLALIGAAPPPQDREVVTIRVQFLGEVCAGLCPSYKLDISDGWAMGLIGIDLDVAAIPVRLQIDHAAYLRFRARMAAVRPADIGGDGHRCQPAGRSAALEVVWYRGEDATVRRSLCEGEQDRALHCAVALGLIDIGIDPATGTPLSPGSAGEMRRYTKCE